MPRIQRFALVSALLLALPPLAATAAGGAEHEPASQGQNTRPDLMVRVTRLTGTGPDGHRHTLYQSGSGAELPFRGLSRIAAVASGDGLPRGGYHGLRAELASGFAVVDRASRRVPSHFTVDGSPYRISLAGTLLVTDSGTQAFGIAVDPSPTGRDGDRNRRHAGGGEWGEDD